MRRIEGGSGLRNAEAAIASLEQQDPGPLSRVYLIYGDETYYHRRLVRAIKRHALDPALEAFNFNYFEHETARVDAVRSAVLTPPAMTSCRLVLVRDPAELVRAGPGQAGAGAADDAAGGDADSEAGDGVSDEAGGAANAASGGQPGSGAVERPGAGAGDEEGSFGETGAAAGAAIIPYAETIRQWSVLLEVVPPGACLVLTLSRDLPSTSPLLKAAAKLQPAADVIRCLPATAKSAEIWVRKLAVELGASVDQEASQALVMRSGTSLDVLEREVEKLVAYVGGDSHRITARDVGEAATPSAEASVFEMVDHIGSRRPYQAVGKLRRLVEQGEPPLRLMAMVTRQVRLIFITREMVETGAPVRDIEAKLGLPTWVVRGYLTQARNFTRAQLVRAMRSLGRLDLDVKTGRRDPAMGLELFILQQGA